VLLFTFAKQEFHREAVSPAGKGKSRWAICFTVGRPRAVFSVFSHFCVRFLKNEKKTKKFQKGLDF